jgi:hypothetical protein
VTLTLDPAADVDKVAIKEANVVCASLPDGDFGDLPVGNTVDTTLTSGDGDITLTACFRDFASNLYRVRRTIRLDTQDPNPSGFQIDGGNTYTKDRVVGCSFTPSDPAPGSSPLYRALAEDCDFSQAVYEQVGSGCSYTLSAGSGTKQLCVRLRDAAGRESADVAATTDTIILDDEAPSLTEFEPQTYYTSSSTVTFNVEATDNLGGTIGLGYTVNNANCPGASPQPLVTPTVNVDLGAGTNDDGVFRVYGCVRDPANNISSVVFRDVTFDNDPPDAPTNVSVVGQSRQLNVSWEAVADDPVSGLLGYRVRYTTDPTWTSGVQTVSVASDQTETLIGGVRNRVTYYVKVYAVDRAGNESVESNEDSTVSGLTQAILPGIFPTENPDYAAPTVTMVEGRVWVVMNERVNNTTSAVRVLSCWVQHDDCSQPGNWSSFSKSVSGRKISSPRMNMLQHNGNKWIGLIEEESDGDREEVIYRCAETADCTAGGNWTRIPLRGGTAVAALEQTLLGFASTSAKMILASVQSGVVRINSCSPREVNCSVGANWSAGSIGTSAYGSDRDHASLVANRERFILAVEQDNGGTDRVRYRMCDALTACTASGNWSGVYSTGNDSARPSLADTGTVFWSTVLRSNGNVQLRRCRNNADCDTASDWAVYPPIVLATVQPGERNWVRLGAGGSTLHATWWNDYAGTLSYAYCPDPEAGGDRCQDITHWTTITVDDSVTGRTFPSVVGAGPNPVVAYMDSANRLRAIVPDVATAVDFAAVPGDGTIEAHWTAQFDLAGSRLLYDDDGGPFWDTTQTLGDPFIETASYTASPLVTTYSSLSKFASTGEPSDDAAMWENVPFDAASFSGNALYTAGGAYDAAVSGPDCYGEPGGKCANFALARDVDNIVTARKIASGAILFAHCDTSATDCSVNGNWAQKDLSQTDLVGTAGTIASVAVADGYAVVLIITSTNELRMSSCLLTDDCTANTSWNARDFQIINNTNTTPYAATSWSSGSNNRLWIATRNESQALRVFTCDMSNCDQAADLTNEGAPAQTVTDLGLDIVAHRNATKQAILAVGISTGARMLLYDGGWATPFNINVGPLLSHQLRVHTGGVHIVLAIGTSNGLYYGECPYAVGDCTTSSTWGAAKVSGLPIQDGVSVDVGRGNGVSFLLARHSRQLHLMRCNGNCTLSDNWHGGPAVRVTSTLAPLRNLRTFGINNGGNPAIFLMHGYGPNSPTDPNTPRVLFGGRMNGPLNAP